MTKMLGLLSSVSLLGVACANLYGESNLNHTCTVRTELLERTKVKQLVLK